MTLEKQDKSELSTAQATIDDQEKQLDQQKSYVATLREKLENNEKSSAEEIT